MLWAIGGVVSYRIHIVPISTNILVDKAVCVCMNALKSEIIRVRSTKFRNSMSNYCAQKKFISQFSHALYRLRKSIKTELQGYFLC